MLRMRLETKKTMKENSMQSAERSISLKIHVRKRIDKATDVNEYYIILPED